MKIVKRHFSPSVSRLIIRRRLGRISMENERLRGATDEKLITAFIRRQLVKN